MGSPFGSRLRAVRQRRGLAQKDLAGPGVSMSYVSRLESGDRLPSPSVIARLAEVLQVDPRELTGETRSASTEQAALRWCEVALAYREGEPRRAVELLDAIEPKEDPPLFAWSVRWLRAVLIMCVSDPAEALAALDELRAGWSPGPAVDVVVEVQRAQVLWELGLSAEAVRAARTAVELSESTDIADRWRVRLRALVALCCHAARSGRAAEAEQALEQLDEALEVAGGGRLAISAWWARAAVTERLGDSARAHASITKALELLDQQDCGGLLRSQVLLTAAAIGLRLPEPDTGGAERALERVRAVSGNRWPRIAARVEAVRAELALHRRQPELCWSAADAALATGALELEDQLRCHLLRVQAVDLAGDRDRLAAAKQALRAALESVRPAAVDPALWRDIARVALRG
ncbi:transcriptional regulator with XRE-family HTH domain [Saccharothrix coeruleofusca]|uniref:helix-turn-helix domain-containing protein n=1 Tax=Saccharothrix coeruleofusca TaxID=33919 RepID=UPI001AE38E36|nr:helix-turn-helix transcriptional regulator [Saccharothrix coeruleofusca]MBP2336795.1 transcriptional regulator with XRE-family HTH domain [Saccharothrix coeruleofusca]